MRENMYWSLLELANYRGVITKEMVQEKYKAQMKKLEDEEEKIYYKYGKYTEKAKEHLEGISSFKFGLNSAYQYCIDDASIAIRNRIIQLSTKPNATLARNNVTEQSAIVTGVRRDIREVKYLKKPAIVKKLKAEGINFDLLVPPEQREEEIYYDVATGKISSKRNTETSIFLAKRKNRVDDGEFSIVKREIYDIRDKATATNETQLTEYEVRRKKLNSITEEVTLLYGEFDLDKFEKDPEYRASFYKAFERARMEQSPYIGSLVDDRHVVEDSLEKNIARKLRKRELGAYDKPQNKSSNLSKKDNIPGVDR